MLFGEAKVFSNDTADSDVILANYQVHRGGIVTNDHIPVSLDHVTSR